MLNKVTNKNCESRNVFLGYDYFLQTLGTALGDFLDKPVAYGVFALIRYSATITFALLILTCIVIFPQLASKSNH